MLSIEIVWGLCFLEVSTSVTHASSSVVLVGVSTILSELSIGCSSLASIHLARIGFQVGQVLQHIRIVVNDDVIDCGWASNRLSESGCLSILLLFLAHLFIATLWGILTVSTIGTLRWWMTRGRLQEIQQILPQELTPTVVVARHQVVCIGEVLLIVCGWPIGLLRNVTLLKLALESVHIIVFSYLAAAIAIVASLAAVATLVAIFILGDLLLSEFDVLEESLARTRSNLLLIFTSRCSLDSLFQIRFGTLWRKSSC